MMITFIETHITWFIGALFVTVFVVSATRALMKAKKIDNEGIETDGVVTRIVDTSDPEDATSSYTTYVEYKDENGQLRESFMALTVRVEHEPGDKVRIRYIPGVHNMVREVKD